MEKETTTTIISDPAAWDAFVRSSGNGTVFSTSAWLDAVAPLMGGRTVRVGAMREGQIVAGVGFVEIDRGGFRKAASPILTPYCGFLHGGALEGEEDSSGEELAGLVRFLRERYHHVLLAHDPKFTDIRPFSWQGWRAAVRYTYLLDIGDPERVREKFRTRARRQIARAEKEFRVGAGCDPAAIGAIHEQTFRAKGEHPLVSGSQVAAFAARLAGLGLIEVRTALDRHDDVAGMQLNVLSGDTVYTLVYGTAPGYHDRGVDSFLMSEAVKRYAGNYRCLDLVGANIPSIAFFKKGFGGDLKPYYVTERYSSTLAFLAFATYSRTKRLFRA